MLDILSKNIKSLTLGDINVVTRYLGFSIGVVAKLIYKTTEMWKIFEENYFFYVCDVTFNFVGNVTSILDADDIHLNEYHKSINDVMECMNDVGEHIDEKKINYAKCKMIKNYEPTHKVAIEIYKYIRDIKILMKYIQRINLRNDKKLDLKKI